MISKYIITKENIEYEINYKEHELPEHIKLKFNILHYNLNCDNSKKEICLILMKNRRATHDWIEFYNNNGSIYTCVYYYLGAYLVRFNTKDNNFIPKQSKIISNFDWYQKFKLNEQKKYLFSLSEVAGIIGDISRVNKLNLFK